MSKASLVVSDAILGTATKEIIINGVIIPVKAPTIFKILKAIHHFSEIELKGKNLLDVAGDFTNIKSSYLRGLSCLINGEEGFVSLLEQATLDEINEAFRIVFSLIDDSDFKVCAFDVVRNEDQESDIIGNKTILGQIATFIDTLHLSYNEVVYEIPYRNLIIMQRDKLRAVNGTTQKKVDYVSGRAMMKKRAQRGQHVDGSI